MLGHCHRIEFIIIPKGDVCSYKNTRDLVSECTHKVGSTLQQLWSNSVEVQRYKLASHKNETTVN